MQIVKYFSFFFILFVSSFQVVFGQEKNDDFQQKLTTIQLDVLDENFEKSHSSLRELNAIFGKNKDKKVMLNALYGQLFLAKKEDQKALAFIKKSINESKKSSNEAKAYAHLSMAKYFQHLNENDDILREVYTAVNLAKNTKNEQLLGDIYYTFYGVYAQLKKTLKTDEYAQKSLYHYTLSGNKNYISLANSAKAVASRYHLELNNEKAYRDSISYYLYQAIRNVNSNKIKTLSHLNMSNFYMRKYVYDSEESVKDSIYKYLKFVENQRNNSYGRRALGSGLIIQGMVEMNDHHYQKAENLMLQALDIFKKDELENRRKLFNTAMALKDLSLKQNNSQKAFEYLQLQYDYNDLIFNKKQNDKIKTLETKYENEKIKQDLTFAKQKNKSKQIQIYLIILLLVFSFIAIFFIIRNYSNKIKLKRQRISLLYKEKNEALQKVKLEEEKYTRLLAERKILEMEKEKISKKAMVNSIQIERKNKVLQHIQEQLNQKNTQISEISKTLKIETVTEKKINTKVDEFNDINPKFFEKLKSLNPKLTTLDLKYCGYIYAGLTNQEIATNLNVETKSVRMSKYRIKKKLNIEKELSLENYLENLT